MLQSKNFFEFGFSDAIFHKFSLKLPQPRVTQCNPRVVLLSVKKPHHHTTTTTTTTTPEWFEFKSLADGLGS